MTERIMKEIPNPVPITFCCTSQLNLRARARERKLVLLVLALFVWFLSRSGISTRDINLPTCLPACLLAFCFFFCFFFSAGKGNCFNDPPHARHDMSSFSKVDFPFKLSPKYDQAPSGGHQRRTMASRLVNRTKLATIGLSSPSRQLH
jgi:hypothetical protein